MANKKKHIVKVDTVKKAALPLIVPVKKDTSSSSSLFQNHLLQVRNNKPQLHFTKYDYLISGILLFLFVLFVWLYVANRKKLSQVIKGFYQTRFTNQNTLDEFSIGNRVSVFFIRFFCYNTYDFYNSGVVLLSYFVVFK